MQSVVWSVWWGDVVLALLCRQVSLSQQIMGRALRTDMSQSPVKVYLVIYGRVGIAQRLHGR